MQRSIRLGFLSLGQFDPQGRDGASLDITARLRFMKSKGFRINIINFLYRNQTRLRLDKDIGYPFTEEQSFNSSSRLMSFNEMDYFQHVALFRYEELPRYQKDIQSVFFKTVNKLKLDFIITVDEGYLPLTTRYLLGIPGAHLFFSLSNVINFSRYPVCQKFLKAGRIFSNSHFLQKAIKNCLGLDALLWLPHVNFERFTADQNKSRTYKVGFMAKGQQISNKLICEIAHKLPERMVIVVGDEFKKCDQANILFLGYMKDIGKFFSMIDILLVPSCEESYSLAILEASACGIPVIANRVGGIPEELGNSGILIDIIPGKNDAWDLTSMADKYLEKINHFMTDDGYYNEYRLRAIARSEQHKIYQERMSSEIIDRYIMPSIASGNG